jgi:hypothetical protein
MIEILKISLIAYMFCALGQNEGMIFYGYQKLIKQLPHYFHYPLGGCYLCFTGQICFWFYLIKYFQNYNLIDHLFFVSSGIFVSAVYNKIYCWLCE